MRLILLAAPAALALTACQPSAPANQGTSNLEVEVPDNGAANDADVEANAVGNSLDANNNVSAIVAGLPDGPRNGTLFRAIFDANQKPCIGVSSSTRLADDEKGNSRWRADCKDNGASFIVVVPPDGMLLVTGPYPHGEPTK